MKRKLIRLAVILLLLASGVGFIASQVLGYRAVYEPRPAYDKTGFVEKKDFTQTNIKLSNSRFEFNLNPEDTTFTLLDKTTLQTWRSNPTHESALIPADARELFVLYYERKIEASKLVSINDESIKYDNYEFRIQDGVVEVLYKIGGKHSITMTDLPRQIEKAKFDEKIIEPLTLKGETDGTIRRNLNFLKSQFNYVETEGRYFLKTITSQDALDILYNLIFEESLYTMEDYEEDAAKFGFETSKPLPYFEFSIKYQLSDLGFTVELVNASIFETDDFPIAYIDILPFFGAGNVGDEGYTVIPDGSGIYIDHNNQKYNSTFYEKRIYGADLSIGTGYAVKPEQGEKIGLPMYGYQKNGYAFINALESGDSMSTIRAGFVTEASTHKIPFAHYRFALRERDAFIFRSSSQSQRVTSFTKAYNTANFKASYQFITKTDATYFDMAKTYQTYLVNRYQLSLVGQAAPLHITLLGGFQEKRYVLGFPTSNTAALTSKAGVLKVVDDIKNLGIDSLSVTYSGFSNGGVKPTAYEKMVYDKAIISEKGLKQLSNTLKSEDIPFYLEYLAQEGYTKAGLNLDKDVVQNIFHDPIYRYDYDEATGLANRGTTIRYILNTKAQGRVINTVMRTSDKVNNLNVSLTGLGSSLASNLEKSNVLFRYDVVDAQIELLEKLSNQNIQLRNPNLYALVYADNILDLAVVGTLHKIVDYDIPFVQLVLNGYFQYAGPAVNTYDNKTTNWHLLKAIETGANLNFTLTEENTIQLVKTEYNSLYATYYAYWLSDIERLYETLENLNVDRRNITNHRVLNAQGSLVEVTYNNSVTIEINYETESFRVVS
ncbi:DUF5696 domain-containing protein [Acholeplasma vituli]|uniref:DUF5696 domain-containing protein n=1 Tax=Paracholeplasma vituli TaxID=69473 RepID=A0ABT2PTJ5_9MOLU|nr:DUF5696 domain-containing protein [Paracholeplasma vituli]MCU0104275.1 DUF5696 domain-containing protein [Paracholeplasma vituli]